MAAETGKISGDGIISVNGVSYRGYGCTKFRSNLFEQIFFKPYAELHKQQHLIYAKAWVEYSLEPNKWYMLSTPLQETYAGDMYVPTTGKENKVDAFEDVTFNETDTSTDFVDSEDVETIYDSNLADVPTIYTIAGDQAVSVNTLPEIDVVPMGVVCSQNIDATVTLKGVDRMGVQLYLLDCRLNTATPLVEGETLTIRTNEHGRYFLSTRSTTGIRQVAQEQDIKVYSPAPGMLTVTCLVADDQLEQVEVFTTDGTKVTSSISLHDSSVTLSVPHGVLIVKVKDRTNHYNHHKVIIR